MPVLCCLRIYASFYLMSITSRLLFTKSNLRICLMAIACLRSSRSTPKSDAPLILCESKIMFLDCPRALRRFLRILSISELCGDFISHASPSMTTSGGAHVVALLSTQEFHRHATSCKRLGSAFFMGPDIHAWLDYDDAVLFHGAILSIDFIFILIFI